MCCLVSLDSRNPHVVMNRGGAVSFGRDPQCTVVLAGSEISHKHARVFYEPDLDETGITSLSQTPFVLQDLSSNGVFVNFQKVAKGNQCRLKHGDLIWFSKLACKTPKSSSHAYVFQVTSKLPQKTVRVPPWKQLPVNADIDK